MNLHHLPATPNYYSKQNCAIAGNAANVARITTDLAHKMVNLAADTTQHSLRYTRATGFSILGPNSA
jgi:hypothetical protein